MIHNHHNHSFYHSFYPFYIILWSYHYPYHPLYDPYHHRSPSIWKFPWLIIGLLPVSSPHGWPWLSIGVTWGSSGSSMTQGLEHAGATAWGWEWQKTCSIIIVLSHLFISFIFRCMKTLSRQSLWMSKSVSEELQLTRSTSVSPSAHCSWWDWVNGTWAEQHDVQIQKPAP